MNTPDEYAEQFNDSLDRCKLNKSFIQQFYVRFLACDPAVAKLFAATDMQRQVEMLGASLHMIMLASVYPNASHEYLGHTAHSHDQRKIPSHLYDKWLECLVSTVAEIDPSYNPAVEQAWRIIMQAGVDYMKAHATSAP